MHGLKGVCVSIENPAFGSLGRMPFWQPLNVFNVIVDYCQYRTRDGTHYPSRKSTSIWTNVGLEARRCTHRTHYLADDAGRPTHTGKGIDLPLYLKHSLPEELVCDILHAAMHRRKGSLVIDLFAGGQSFARPCERLGLKYVAFDIMPRVYCGRGEDGRRRYVETHEPIDLRGVSVREVVLRACERVGCRARDVLLIHASPPCTTFSQIQRLRPPSQRHRDIHTLVPQSEQARIDDELAAHWARQLLPLLRG